MKCSQCPVKKGVRVCEDGDALCVACSAAKAQKSAQETTTTEVSLSDLMVKLTTMGSDLAEVKSGHREIINSINFLSSKFDEINDKMDKLEQSNNELKKENTDLRVRVSKLESDVQNLEQYSRRQNLEIIGIPESQNENVGSITLKVLQHIDASVSADDVDVTHRLGSKTPNDPNLPQPQPKSRPIIVRFTARRVRDKIYDQRMSLKTFKTKDLGFKGDGNIFVNENLLPSTKQLLAKANLARKAKAYRYLWTSNGRLLVRKNADSPALLIACEADIAKIQ